MKKEESLEFSVETAIKKSQLIIKLKKLINF
jgi:hypothetical protein